MYLFNANHGGFFIKIWYFLYGISRNTSFSNVVPSKFYTWLFLEWRLNLFFAEYTQRVKDSIFTLKIITAKSASNNPCAWLLFFVYGTLECNLRKLVVFLKLTKNRIIFWKLVSDKNSNFCSIWSFKYVNILKDF